MNEPSCFDTDCNRDDCTFCAPLRVCVCCLRAAYTVSLAKGERDIVALKREKDGCLVCRDCERQE